MTRLFADVWDANLIGYDKLVLLALAWSASEGDESPSMDELRRLTGFFGRAIRPAINRLEAGGHLTRHYIEGRTIYRLSPVERQKSACYNEVVSARVPAP